MNWLKLTSQMEKWRKILYIEFVQPKFPNRILNPQSRVTNFFSELSLSHFSKNDSNKPKKKNGKILKNKIHFIWNLCTYLADEADERLSLILFKYSDGLIKWFEPSDDPFGKLGGTNGKTNCLFTKFGPFDRDGDDCPDVDVDATAAAVTIVDEQYWAWYVWYSSDDETLLLCSRPNDNVLVISFAFLLAEIGFWKQNEKF